MKIFISYSDEDTDVAEQLQLALTGCGYSVFFDKRNLSGGDNYNLIIEQEIIDSDLFIFLISPDSIEESAYTLTELEIAREKWPHPKDRVLPVLVRKTDFKLIPHYLAAVTVLKPKGNIAAEVSSWVRKHPRLSELSLFTKLKKYYIANKIVMLLIVLVLASVASFPFMKMFNADIVVKKITVIINTGSVNRAGTAANVFIKLADKSFRLYKPNSNDFNMGSLGQYELDTASYGITNRTLQSEPIQLSHDETGKYPPGDAAWYVDDITIIYSTDNGDSCLLYRKNIGWVPSDREVPPYKSLLPPFDCPIITQLKVFFQGLLG